MSAIVCSEPALNFLRAVYNWNWRSAYFSLNGTSMTEMLRLLDQIDRDDLKDMRAKAPTFRYDFDMPRMEYAMSVVLDRKKPATSPGDLASTGQVNRATEFLARRSPLRIPRDPTAIFPAPLAAVPALTDDDFRAAAAELGVEVAAIRAVASVESGGRSGFSGDGRAIIRYELHRFDKFTKGAYRQTHPHLAQTSLAAGNPYHAGGQANEWSMMYGACVLRFREEEAIKSASWGMFQVMGEHAETLGWKSAWDFARDLSTSAKAHLQSFTTYCAHFGMVKHIRNKDWAKFARGYNGPNYAVNNYDVNIENAYNRFVAAGI